MSVTRINEMITKGRLNPPFNMVEWVRAPDLKSRVPAVQVPL